jgi:DMSO/TMAO reductase YedYZ molybdopterin-dependent catalytic subunit
MTTATLDRVLAGLVLALAATGLLSLRSGAPDDGWVFVGHGLLGGALAAATFVKLRRSLPRAVHARRWGRLGLALVLTLATSAALVGGFAWVASGRLLSVGSWTVLTLHAWVGLALVPLVVIHLVPRRWRLLRPRRLARRAAPISMSRRSLLATAGLAAAGLAAFALTATVERALGGVRRFTGSRWLPPGSVPPATTFFGEGPPPIDDAAWRVAVTGPDGATRRWSIPELRGLGEVEQEAVLDCTSGWAVRSAWRGVPVGTLVVVPPDRRLRVTSATGWGTVLTADEARHALLATGVAGSDLAVGNGYPCRLVVPDRRGLDWVKWVTTIEVIA